MAKTHSLRRGMLYIVTFTLLAGLYACNLNLGRTTAGQPETTAAAPAEGGISPAVLTQVAATIYAPLQATLTQQAAAPQAALPGTPTPLLEQPRPTGAVSSATSAITEGAAAPTSTEQSPTVAVPPQNQSSPAPTSTLAIAPSSTASTSQVVGFPPFATYVPAFPPGSYSVQSGKPFSIAGVNLPSCGGVFTANFLIVNQSGSPFESLSIQLRDLSTNEVLAASIITDAPFMFDDHSCFPGGISRLDNGYALFVGASLGASRISRHTIQASLLFCSRNNLDGRCFPRSVEFVVP